MNETIHVCFGGYEESEKLGKVTGTELGRETANSRETFCSYSK